MRCQSITLSGHLANQSLAYTSSFQRQINMHFVSHRFNPAWIHVLNIGVTRSVYRFDLLIFVIHEYTVGYDWKLYR